MTAVLAFALVLLCPGAAAQDSAEVERQLEGIRERIALIEQELARETGARDRLTGELRGVETEIGRLSREIRRLDAELERHRAELDTLAARERELEAELRRQRDALAAQLRAAYAIGRQPALKLLLNLEDVRAVGRTLAYFRYYNGARLAEIAAVGERLAQLADVRARRVAARDRVDTTRARLLEEQRQKSAQRSRRGRLLDELNARVASRQTELGELDRDRQRLERLLEELTVLFAAVPGGEELRPFSSLRGALRWPLEGATLLASGETKPGGMSREGILIAAPRGAEVRAVSHGRVAYADWLRGFGLLAIVDHGEGFMSLYAFNESLFAEIGDWVAPGEIIAAVGDSGGRAQPALYFELRHQGRPVGLAPWFKGR